MSNPYPGCDPDRRCVHGNKWGGECEHCDGYNNLKPLPSDRGPRRVASATVSARPNEWGEWVVRARDQHGRRWPECDYHTTDRDDACETAVRMVAQ